MNAIQEYVACLREMVESQKTALEMYRKLDERQRAEIELCEKLIATYKEIICRLIEGQVSEETKTMMLNKFRD